MHVHRWWEDVVVAHGRLPLACLLLGFIVGFLLIRISVRLIRKQVRWWPGNVRAGDVHIHHMVFGVVLVLGSGMGLIALYQSTVGVISALAAVFGVGAALVLDEFALIY
ncbi:Lysine--tRNA ligase [Nocardia seriolae]|nr:Lysine--tRNA ligase [Nocardia seriolae]